MKNLSFLLVALLLLVNVACQKDDEVAPLSNEKKQLMTEKWTVDQVEVFSDYTMKTSFGEMPVKQSNTMSGLSTKCEYAATMRFADAGLLEVAYLQNYCGAENPAANNIKWSADDKVTELKFIGENLAGFSVNIEGNHLSNGNEAVFTVKELSAQKLVIERTISITSFFSQEVLDLYAKQGVTLNGTYRYTTTYIAK